ncbi:MAG: F0F1 ATP synthase subunit delta [Candidatus Moranbacteria bacterium]|nr:F0F1 ATP synthase subunit delta [Candidatus Moranbacteria bacterium]
MKISSAQYGKVLAALSEEKGDAKRVAASFLSFVRRRRATRKLDDIVRVAERQVDRVAGRVCVLAETAVPADDAMRREIEAAAREAFPGNEVVVSYVVLLELLGGVRLSSGDEVLDASVGRRLREMEGVLKGSTYG